VTQDAAKSAQETVKDSGREHAQQLKHSAQQSAQDIGSPSTDQPQYTSH
jgi:hypothetical protein